MKHLLITLAALLPAGLAHADLNTAQLAQDHATAGYSRIEIKTGLNQTKVAAWNATSKVETVYDNATGAVLKSEREALAASTSVLPGLSIRDRTRDFVDGLRMAAVGDDKGGRGRGKGADDTGTDDRGGVAKGRMIARRPQSQHWQRGLAGCAARTDGAATLGESA